MLGSHRPFWKTIFFFPILGWFFLWYFGHFWPFLALSYSCPLGCTAPTWPCPSEAQHLDGLFFVLVRLNFWREKGANFRRCSLLLQLMIMYVLDFLSLFGSGRKMWMRWKKQLANKSIGNDLAREQSHVELRLPLLTSWGKRNDGNSPPHECRLHYLLERHIFGIILTAMDSEIRGCHGQFFVRDLGLALVAKTCTHWSLGFKIRFRRQSLNEPIARTLRHAYKRFRASIRGFYCIRPVSSNIYRQCWSEARTGTK